MFEDCWFEPEAFECPIPLGGWAGMVLRSLGSGLGVTVLVANGGPARRQGLRRHLRLADCRP